jgi:hypothetical protein
MATAYHMVHYRRFVAEVPPGAAPIPAFEGLCRSALDRVDKLGLPCGSEPRTDF